MKTFTDLAISNPEDLIFGKSPNPLTTKSGMVLGGGLVYPELNFTLPAMTVNEETYPIVQRHYRQIAEGALKRAAELEAPGVQLEFESLPAMTENPEWAIDLCKIILEGMDEAKEKYGLKSVLRMTPNDNREMLRPSPMKSGKYWDAMLETFEGCCNAGAELISIESVGGKEVHDEALTYCDIKQVIFALCTMGVRDMKFLWSAITRLSHLLGVFVLKNREFFNFYRLICPESCF